MDKENRFERYREKEEERPHQNYEGGTSLLDGRIRTNRGGWGQQESKPHSVQRPEGRRKAYLCRCDNPRHRPELSLNLAAHEPDARGGCGLPPVLSTLAHGDFPRSVCNRSELLVCQLRSRASRAPSPFAFMTQM